MVDTHGTGKMADEEIEKKIRKTFDMTVRGIITALDLRRPIYRKTAAYGHFGRSEDSFSWEKTDKVNSLA